MPHILGGKKRVKGFCLNLIGHPAPVIRDRDHDVLTRNDLILRGSIFFVQIHIRGFERQFSTVRHSVTCIHRQIENGKFELVRISECPPRPTAQHSFDTYLLSERTAKHI